MVNYKKDTQIRQRSLGWSHGDHMLKNIRDEIHDFFTTCSKRKKKVCLPFYSCWNLIFSLFEFTQDEIIFFSVSLHSCNRRCVIYSKSGTCSLHLQRVYEFMHGMYDLHFYFVCENSIDIYSDFTLAFLYFK